MQNTQEIITALQAQFDSIQTRLAAIDKEAAFIAAQYREQRSAVTAEAQPLAKALAALGVTVNLPGVSTNGTGKKFVMSETAKANIRAGLQRAREKKAAAAAQAAQVPATPVNEKAAPVQPVPATKSTPAKDKKAGARA